MKDADELAGILDAQADAAPVGTGWQHKKSGHFYLICGHALREDDLEPCVLYHDLTDDRVWWCRPGVEFLDGRLKRAPECDC